MLGGTGDKPDEKEPASEEAGSFDARSPVRGSGYCVVALEPLVQARAVRALVVVPRTLTRLDNVVTATSDAEVPARPAEDIVVT
jgi:hypothetical protein